MRSIQRGNRRGNQLLELCFVFVPLMALLLAIMDFGVAVFLKSTFQHAVREGVRYAVTFQTSGGLGHDASIKRVVTGNSLGFLSGTSGQQKIFIRYYNPDTLIETNQNLPGNIVEVSVENFNLSWMAPLLRSHTPLTINVRSSDRMEGLPGGAAPPAR